ncbi:MAG: class IV adenylate cyclase [Anaerolineae bacterium]|nr:MAG: class IV adenylate cyclase [Anaerolineae bacterium]
MGLEIECKLYIPSLETIQTHLLQAGAVLTNPRTYEHNIRYEGPNGDFTSNGIVLRLRRDQDIRLTYKAPASQVAGGMVTRLELETTIGDFEIMDAILQHLGYRHNMVYEKYRTTYHLPDVPDVELVMDEMPYGNFLEVEGTPEGIEAALAKLKLTNASRIEVGYVDLFELLRRHYQFTFRDLTFQNFIGINIDPQIFVPPHK